MASAYFDSLLAYGSGVVNHPPPPKILETAGRITMEFLPDVKYHREARSSKIIFTELMILVCKLWVSKVQKHSNSLLSENATSANASFTKSFRIINIDVRN